MYSLIRDKFDNWMNKGTNGSFVLENSVYVFIIQSERSNQKNLFQHKQQPIMKSLHI